MDGLRVRLDRGGHWNAPGRGWRETSAGPIDSRSSDGVEVRHCVTLCGGEDHLRVATRCHTRPHRRVEGEVDLAELQDLAEDIKQHGQCDPVWLFEGKVLDGRNRARACDLAGVKPKTVEFNGDHRQAIDIVLPTNFHRRYLTPSQVGRPGRTTREWTGTPLPGTMTTPWGPT